jgi:hypothetical protein
MITRLGSLTPAYENAYYNVGVPVDASVAILADVDFTSVGNIQIDLYDSAILGEVILGSTFSSDSEPEP